jgi:hypothetical protein
VRGRRGCWGQSWKGCRCAPGRGGARGGDGRVEWWPEEDVGRQQGAAHATSAAWTGWCGARSAIEHWVPSQVGCSVGEELRRSWLGLRQTRMAGKSSSVGVGSYLNAEETARQGACGSGRAHSVARLGEMLCEQAAARLDGGGGATPCHPRDSGHARQQIKQQARSTTSSSSE